MKHQVKFQIKFFAVLVFITLLSTNVQFIFGQNRNSSDNRERIENSNLTVIKQPNPNESDLLSVSASDDQLFIGNRNGILKSIDIPNSGTFFPNAKDVSMSQDRLPLRQIFFENSLRFVLKGNTIYSPTGFGSWKGIYAHPSKPLTPKPLVLTPEFWSIGFPNTKSACLVGVNLQKGKGNDIVDSGLLLCNQDLNRNPRDWKTPMLPATIQDEKISSQLTAISFHNNQGWLVGANGIIWHTEDGGNEWNAEVSNTQNPLLNVYTIDENNVWAVGFNSTILNLNKSKKNNPQPDNNRKPDGNKKPDRRTNSETDPKTENKEKEPETYPEKAKQKVKEVKEGIDNTIRNQFPTIIIAPTPTVPETKKPNDSDKTKTDSDKTKTDSEQTKTDSDKTKTDSEQTKTDSEETKSNVEEESAKGEWQELKNNPLAGQNIRLWAVKFAPDKQNGWIIGDSGTILYTKNGGKKWEQIKLVSNQNKPLFPVAPNFYAMHIDNNYCWIVGSQGVILRMSY